MQTSASSSVSSSVRAALRRAWRVWALRLTQAAHQRRMARELMAMSEREMLDLAIGRGEIATLLHTPPAPRASPAAPLPQRVPRGRGG
jgi:uncharacterized protein YjiS (DUF1127 family)